MTSTPLVSTAKGGTTSRVEPIGGRLGFGGDFETDIKDTASEINAFFATGSISFNSPVINEGPVNVTKAAEESPWLAITSEGFKVASSLFGEATNLMPDVKDAGAELLQQVTGFGIKEEKILDPEAEAKKKQEAAFAKNRMAELEDMLRKVPQQELEQRVNDAIRNEVNPEEVEEILGLNMGKAEVLTRAHILAAAVEKGRREKAAKDAKKNQSIASTAKKADSNSMRLDAQEGNSTVANAIATAG